MKAVLQCRVLLIFNNKSVITDNIRAILQIDFDKKISEQLNT